jgi:hypothetical protein
MASQKETELENEAGRLMVRRFILITIGMLKIASVSTQMLDM